MDLFFLVTLAITPGIAIALFIYIKDKHEPEPVKLLIISFLLGGLSLGLDLLIAIPLDALTDIDEYDLKSQAIHSFAIVAFLEEICKFAFLRVILYPNKNFNEPLDGIVYSVMIGMGFATAENLIYALTQGGDVAFTRMFSAIPAHALFAVLMGYFMGKAKFLHYGQLRYGLIGLLVATLFHGTYDYFLFISFVPGMWIGSVIALIIAFLLSRKAVQLHQQASPFSESSETKK